ncbi:uncharacterized protein LOC125458166 isoform X2 [Stegostoma tigrinum]|uniref:uncharacterized protein LOC125458166 isoform X2 n=1 Tax=Stegostoma tigrinum TaxID=3053191 RepID=UPI00202B60A7|nr:uncharacterized protein LOC125458166 isoform X2 [Stegostoma tigrinum]
MFQEKKKALIQKRRELFDKNYLLLHLNCNFNFKKRKKGIHRINFTGMASGRKKQIFALLKWRKGKKKKAEKEEVVTSDDIDCGSCQYKRASSWFGRSQSEDSGLDLSNPSCLYQKQSDTQENIFIHSRKTSTSSDLYSDLSCGSRTVLLPRTYNFILSDEEDEFKAPSLSEDDDFFGLKDIIQTINLQYSVPELRETVKSDFTDVRKSETECKRKHTLSSNNWCNKNKWKTEEEHDILRRQQTIFGSHEQVERSSFQGKISISRTSGKGMGVLHRICDMMEKITELERDRMVLLRQNNELQYQLSQSQQIEMVTRESRITEVKSQVSLGSSSEANARFEQSNSSPPTLTDVASTFT